MTKQEQIEEMAVIGCVRNPQAHTAEECAKCDFKQGQCNAYRHAEALIKNGYGDISGYKTEREMLGSQIKALKQRLNNKYVEIDNLNRDYRDSFEKLKAQEREIEQLKEKCEELRNEKWNAQDNIDCYCDEMLDKIKQAKIDVLTELRNKCHNYYPSIDHYCCSVKAVNLSDINKMIEELDK